MYSHYSFSPNTGQNKFLWLKKIKNILIECGFSGMWDNQSYPNAKWLITATKQKLHDLFLNTRYASIQNSSSTYNYISRILKNIKSEFVFLYTYWRNKSYKTVR